MSLEGLKDLESESEVAQLCPTLWDPIDCSLLGSSVHGIFQAIVLEWIAISLSRGSSQPRARTWVSRIVDRRFTVRATREVLKDLRRSKTFPPFTDSSHPWCVLNVLPWDFELELCRKRGCGERDPSTRKGGRRKENEGNFPQAWAKGGCGPLWSELEHSAQHPIVLPTSEEEENLSWSSEFWPPYLPPLSRLKGIEVEMELGFRCHLPGEEIL